MLAYELGRKLQSVWESTTGDVISNESQERTLGGSDNLNRDLKMERDLPGGEWVKTDVGSGASRYKGSRQERACCLFWGTERRPCGYKAGSLLETRLEQQAGVPQRWMEAPEVSEQEPHRVDHPGCSWRTDWRGRRKSDTVWRPLGRFWWQMASGGGDGEVMDVLEAEFGGGTDRTWRRGWGERVRGRCPAAVQLKVSTEFQKRLAWDPYASLRAATQVMMQIIAPLVSFPPSRLCLCLITLRCVISQASASPCNFPISYWAKHTFFALAFKAPQCTFPVFLSTCSNMNSKRTTSCSWSMSPHVPPRRLCSRYSCLTASVCRNLIQLSEFIKGPIFKPHKALGLSNDT